MLSRRGRKRRAPARFQEATPNTRSRRSATVTARSDDHNGDDDSPSAITSDTSATVGPAANDISGNSNKQAVENNALVSLYFIDYLLRRANIINNVLCRIYFA